jgi:hypothetical protein
MGLPLLLVILFFITLNFNPKVLYAPSDFQNEDNFLLLTSGVRNLSGNLDDVQEQLDAFKSQIHLETQKSIGEANQQEREKLLRLLDSKISLLQNKVESAKESAQEVAQQVSDTTSIKLISPNISRFIRHQILQKLSDGNSSKTTHRLLEDVKKELQTEGIRVTSSHIAKEIRYLMATGYIQRFNDENGVVGFRKSPDIEGPVE